MKTILHFALAALVIPKEALNLDLDLKIEGLECHAEVEYDGTEYKQMLDYIVDWLNQMAPVSSNFKMPAIEIDTPTVGDEVVIVHGPHKGGSGIVVDTEKTGVTISTQQGTCTNLHENDLVITKRAPAPKAGDVYHYWRTR